ncbi:hypothetical protein H2200_006710 [Cladophialophora chaetospira]|uniref:Transcription factor TFIIIB component B'' Myb domain-containing protein n=1 Tax=Cladophialophora chaetospira TaxID=386627 RepID=A0AA39CI46_9EURO|nr:hypothetical protein H2200_006710 [Cladophialophora chaetospira]
MPSFSSVVRKPGQKIQPKGPRRNVPRNPARKVPPPSSASESQRVSPADLPVDTASGSQEPELQLEAERETRSVAAGNAIPSILPSNSSRVPSVVPSVERAGNTPDRPSDNVERFATSVPGVIVEKSVLSSHNVGTQILHPVDTRQRERSAVSDTIPTITTIASSTTSQKRKATNEPTPIPLGDSPHEIQRTDESRKRQKTTRATAAVGDLGSRTPPPSKTIPTILRSSPQERRSESRTSDALIQDATTGAATVSELAHDIENRARSQRSRSERRSESQAADTEESAADTSTQANSERPKKKRKSKSERIQELAQQVVDNAINGGNEEDDTEGRRRSRLTTPENAEELEIDPEKVHMDQLTKDIKIGRRSETGKRMQENWSEIKDRRKKEVEKRRDAARRKKNPTNEEEREPEEAAVPQQIIVNGVIVVANESREVAFGAGVEQAAREQADVAIEDDRIYKYVTQATVGKNAGREKRSHWNEDTTNLFYQGLRMFGTDFSMIANLFPESVDRRVVKKKYVAELQIDAERVDKCVAAKESVSLDEYAAMTSMEFEDPEKLMKELEEEEKRLRAEDAKRREDQGYVMNHDEADVPIPTTETDDVEPQTAEGEDQDEDATTPAPTRRTQAPSTARSDRITALAERVVEAAVPPKKKQTRRTREPTGTGRGGRGGRKGKRAVEGIEERIGPLDEVER